MHLHAGSNSIRQTWPRPSGPEWVLSLRASRVEIFPGEYTKVVPLRAVSLDALSCQRMAQRRQVLGHRGGDLHHAIPLGQELESTDDREVADRGGVTDDEHGRGLPAPRRPRIGGRFRDPQVRHRTHAGRVPPAEPLVPASASHSRRSGKPVRFAGVRRSRPFNSSVSGK